MNTSTYYADMIKAFGIFKPGDRVWVIDDPDHSHLELKDKAFKFEILPRQMAKTYIKRPVL